MGSGVAPGDSATFLGLAVAASVTQLFAFHTRRNQVFHATAVIAPLVLLQQSLHVPELREEAHSAKQFRALASVTEPEPSSDEAQLAAGLLAGVLQELEAEGGIVVLGDGDDSELRTEAHAGLASPPPETLSATGR